MNQKQIRFGVIGCGLMGREFASAAGRWCHLSEVDFAPQIVAVCDTNAATAAWFKDRVPTVKSVYSDYRQLLSDSTVDAVYCAVPHNLHEQLYCDILRAGKHLLGEKPFGIDKPAAEKILACIREHPKVFVACSSEMPFFPGAYQVFKLARDGRFGRIIDVESGLWHSSDLNPQKAINWKRRREFCGEYGCLGDLGMHASHLPLRLGWLPADVRAVFSNLVEHRPDGKGGTTDCDTWDNATLFGRAKIPGQDFPITISTKRIAPGHANSFFIRVSGMDLSADFSSQHTKRLATLPYKPGGEQAWHVIDQPYDSAYKTISGPIFEFGFSDALLQMWAAFCDELTHGRDGMSQPLYCATPQEALCSHDLFTAALKSHATSQAVEVPRRG